MRPFRRGDTLMRAGVLTLPPSAWTGVVSLFDLRNPRSEGAWGITVTLTDTGPNAQAPGQRDYAVVLSCPASVTATWPVQGPQQVLELQGRLVLTDGLGQVSSSARFTLKVEN